ncbi:uncharacterized protein EV422DRAFT_550393 [Fimicolochytrium jonesii]|uniref:uncharacterized protein n=1 Tax=Fimicolochytrium jonesii TaxID=1396493 RepID=UPI0022FEC89B|nr:uncharacterized protein EV422DRAFT_550393 [Fimicolochytrium jonesii]KAI8822659.1 hypothetical protein EV422DRAFT_550393 [Fimicolochytrium jonesii]
MVGAMFEHGLGRPMDMAAAIRWYQQSASRNHTDSLSAMGRIHETGKGVPQDPRTAYELYLLAAEAGHVDAMCCVASLLQRVPQSLTNYDADGSPAEAAVAWYRLAAQHGSPRGQNALGSCYYRGLGGVERDYGNAVVWFRRAAESGDPAAHNNLGICYEEGVGVARDVVMAKTLYKLAAAGGHAGATNNLGYLALVEKNFMEAIHQFHLAITLGR